MARQVNADGTYTVKKGDTLSEIANDSNLKSLIAGSTINERVNTLVKLNNIQDRNLIYVDQVLKLSGTATTVATNTSSKANITAFGLQSNTDRTVFAIWTWDKSNTENYKVKWEYHTGDAWFVGDESTVTIKQSVYNAPQNATRVRFRVMPVSKKHKVNGKETTYWTAQWSTIEQYNFADNPPETPPVPSVKIEQYTLTTELDNLNLNAEGIQFQVVKNNEKVVYNGKSTIVTGYASYSCKTSAGAEYKVRARGYRGDVYGDWSEYSEIVKTIPATPSGITTCRASTETSVYLEWSAAEAAESYDIEYAEKKEYFDGSNQTTIQNGIEYTHYELGGLETGRQYFFRVRAVNVAGESSWSEPVSTVIGTFPTAPTTWSSTTTAISGDPLTLHWIHNSADGSYERRAKLSITIDGSNTEYTLGDSAIDNSIFTYTPLTEKEREEGKTNYCSIKTSGYKEGTTILWQVCTAGVTLDYGDWSIQRTVTINAPATLTLEVTDANERTFTTLTSFPFYAYALGGPSSQVPLGYHLTVVANESYETVDNVGNVKMVNRGDEVYSKYFDISGSITVEFSAGNINLDNNISYTVKCIVTMDSGLSAEQEFTFNVSWTDIEYEPNAEISIDMDAVVAHIRPYCEDVNGNIIEGLYLSVYRREFDGSFTEIVTNVENSKSTYVTDPHPALDYARYRIVAIDKATGAVSYCDLPGYPVGEYAIIIQWDEQWSTFDTTDESQLANPPWSGSLLRLPYNVDVTERSKVDVSLIDYIGRSHPVAYYGTQRSEGGTWSTDIDKKDEETIYALRRLAVWPGDVYVREPSGVGYWANITVSMDQKHRELVVPVTLEVTRVEGGI